VPTGDASISAGVMTVESLSHLGGMIQDIGEMAVLCRELSQFWYISILDNRLDWMHLDLLQELFVFIIESQNGFECHYYLPLSLL
jgi:hypothetical protein